MPDDDEDDEVEHPRRGGLLTEKDIEWLKGQKENGGTDQKHALRIALSTVMEDINTLLSHTPENISEPSTDSFSELFTYLDSDDKVDTDGSNNEADTDDSDDKISIDREQCAENLITLAYIITNEPIDYTDIAEDIVLHPKNESTPPDDPNRPQSSAMTSQPIAQLLSFRRALTGGIRRGKSRVESKSSEEIPDTILIDANTKLYKEPTKERLKPDGSSLDPDAVGFDTDDWGDALAKWIDAYHPDSDPSNITYEEALETMITEINTNVLYRLSQRRNISDQPTNRNKLPYY